MDILTWLNKHFRVYMQGNEAQFVCPKCKSTERNFYFNVNKLVGHCFRAKCSYSPTLSQLQELVRSFEDIDGLAAQETQEPPPVAIPDDAKPLLEMRSGRLLTRFRTTVERISRDRGLPPATQHRFGLMASLERVYVPVYDEGELVGYLGRAKWWLKNPPEPKYETPHGSKMNQYLFNWGIAQGWRKLTLVENTFNAMWLEPHCVTSCFGSNLSDGQIERIAAAQTRSVLLFWDESADRNASRSVDKLRREGINASYGILPGQPDDHEIACIRGAIEVGHSAASEGVLRAPLRCICGEARTTNSRPARFLPRES